MPTMLALSPPVFSTYGWPLEDPIGHEQIYFSREAEKTIDTIANSNFFQSQPPEILELDHFASFTDYSGDPNMVKKLNHNASERHRRKKMNCLYSSLRLLLPAANETAKGGYKLEQEVLSEKLVSLYKEGKGFP
ncbi:hypothetical protein GH714_033765 [Hevea brasiliensis]|uniref:BHLH domain-containing protein n=1 Tax=Hevea brasiliensis TaxID=3981 RepID=A0A6A6KLC2_HEVBR|nr:hypothetical protein GH714_033765 [Hevea brasiliensis]